MTGPISRATVMLACLALPTAALAQGATPKTGPAGRPGRFGRLTFATAAVSDGNVFAAQAPRAQGDLISRSTTSVEGGYRSTRVELAARYGFGAELYREHAELNRLFARQEGGGELRWRATRRLQFGAAVDGVSTETPAELNIGSLLSAGRARAERATADGTVAYDLTPVTGLAGGFDYSGDSFGAGRTRTRHARVGLNRRGGGRSDYRVSYAANLVGFSGVKVADSREFSHVVTGGWTGTFSRSTTLALEAGPRIGHGKTHPEWSALLRHASVGLDLSLGVSRTLSTAIGATGTLDVRQVTLAGGYHPVRRLTLGAVTAWARSTQSGSDATVRTLQVDGAFQAEHGVSFMMSGRFGHQAGTVAGAHASISLRSLSVGVTFSLPGARVHSAPIGQR